MKSVQATAPARVSTCGNSPARGRAATVDSSPARGRAATVDSSPARGRAAAVDSSPARGRAAAVDSSPARGRAAAGARLLCAAWLLGSSSGCFIWTSSGEGDKLRQDVDAHAARLREVEKAQTDQLEQLRTAEKKAQNSIDELEGVIERATSVVQRNSADVTVQVSELQTKLAVVEGRMAELQYAIEELKKGHGGGSPAGVVSSGSGGEATPPAETRPPADKNEHYAAAYRAYSDRDFNKARNLFRSFIEKYKSDAQADNAQYWIGASYLVENRPATALAELRKVIESFRGGDAVDEALLDMAEAFYRLKACSDARTTLDTLIKTQANSPLVDKAKQKLKDMRKLGKEYCTS